MQSTAVRINSITARNPTDTHTRYRQWNQLRGHIRHRDLLVQHFPTSLSCTMHPHSSRTGITLAISKDYHEYYGNLKWKKSHAFKKKKKNTKPFAHHTQCYTLSNCKSHFSETCKMKCHFLEDVNIVLWINVPSCRSVGTFKSTEKLI